MSKEELQIDDISICAKAPFKGEASLDEIFQKISEFEVPEEFKNKMIDIDEEDIRGSTIIFADKSPEGTQPSEIEAHYFLADFSEDEDEIHVHAELDGNLIEEIGNLFEQFLDIVDEISVRTFITSMSTDVEFEQLNLPISTSSEYELKGVNLNKGDYNYDVQDMDVLGWDTDEVRISGYYSGEFSVKKSEAKTFIPEQLETVQEFIREVGV